MTLESVVEKPFIFRPNFTREDISLRSNRKNERRFVPSVLVPHTVEVTHTSAGCVFKFEYLIDETPESNKIELTNNIWLTVGKYTDKVIELSFKCSDLETLETQLEEAQRLIEERKKNIGLESVKRNYDLAVMVLRLALEQVKVNPELREVYSNTKPCAETK